MTTAPDFEPDLTLAEAAAILRKSTDLVARWARADQLPGAYQVTKRGRWAVRRSEFDAWRSTLGRHRDDDEHALEPPSPRSRKRRAA